MLFVVIASALFSTRVFVAITVFLFVFSGTWLVSYMLPALWATYKMREDTGKDWDAMLRKLQAANPDGSADVMHIVIIPNYKEDEHMLLQTLQNLGRSPLARACMRVVLAMEAREGEEARKKADRLISQAADLFAEIIATYHPSGLPGELAGKSSNSQWAYRQACYRFSQDLAQIDSRHVFLSVGDADTIWHPQYFSAVSYKALQMPEQEREWAFWQPPVLPVRNVFSVPGANRLAAYATLQVELGGMTNQYLGSHQVFSSYSFTLAMARHPLVGGWDTDVTAEDHHMYMKCYFASLWSQIGQDDVGCSAVPKVQLSPVYLPSLIYLVEADGWLSSLYARYQQARRHAEGVAEVSYTLLQYFSLIKATWSTGMPGRTHRAVLALFWKLFAIHIMNAVQSLTMFLSAVLAGYQLLLWAISGGGASELLQLAIQSQGLLATAQALPWSTLQRAFLVLACSLTPVGIMATMVNYSIMRDALEGWLTRDAGAKGDRGSTKFAASGAKTQLVQGSVPAALAFGTSALSLRRKIGLALMLQTDFSLWAEFAVLVHQLIPVMLSSLSLFFNTGKQFEYVVAAKPK